MDNYQAFCEKTAARLFTIINEHGSLLQWRKEWSQDCCKELPQGNSGLYRGGNLFNLFFTQVEQGFQSNQWLTFNQVKKQGGTVKKGAKSQAVYYWSFQDKPVEDKITGEAIIKSVPFLKCYCVFNLEQTSLFGDYANLDVIRDVEHLLKATDVVVNHFGTSAFYSPITDVITLPQPSAFYSRESYHATLLHEISHWTGHSTRLNRDSLENYSVLKLQAEEELVAEIGSFFLCSFFNINGLIENHASYVQGWQTLLNKNEIMRATNNAAKAFHFLIEKLNPPDALAA